jgi:hypothetical protein
MLRSTLLLAGLLASSSALAGEMKAEEARRFVVGKLFSFTCFEGTRGMGRVYADGSVAGTIQFRGEGPIRFASLPADTLRVKGDAVCAKVNGLPMEPCFNVNQTDGKSFRGSVWGLGFAYCDFTRKGRVETAAAPLKLRSTVASTGR